MLFTATDLVPTLSALSTRDLVKLVAACSHIITEGEVNPNYRGAVLEAADAARIILSRLGAEPPTRCATTRTLNALARKRMMHAVALAENLP
jgi:hypothetical protein